MDTVSVRLEFPRDLLGALDVSESDLQSRLREIIAVELFRAGSISSGKGAELLEVSKEDFVRLLARRGISYFTESPAELRLQIERSEALLNEVKQ